MGDCGSFDAQVGVRFSFKQKEQNKEEVVQEFLDKHKLSVQTTIGVDKEGIITRLRAGESVILRYSDFESWGYGPESRDRCTEETLEADIKDLEVALDSYYNLSGYSAVTVRKAIVEDLIYVDLKALKKYNKYNWLNSDLEGFFPLLSTSGSIYCETDNSTMGVLRNTDELHELLQLPEARLELYADGNGNC